MTEVLVVLVGLFCASIFGAVAYDSLLDSKLSECEKQNNVFKCEWKAVPAEVNK